MGEVRNLGTTEVAMAVNDGEVTWLILGKTAAEELGWVEGAKLMMTLFGLQGPPTSRQLVFMPTVGRAAVGDAPPK